MERESVFPEYASEEEEKVKKAKVVEVVKALYEVAPKLFTGQNLDQKKMFVRLLDMLLDTNGGEGLLKIIEGVVDLYEGEREDLTKILEVGRLSNKTHKIPLMEWKELLSYRGKLGVSFKCAIFV